MKKDFSALLKKLEYHKGIEPGRKPHQRASPDQQDLSKILTSGQVKQMLADAGSSMADLKQIVQAAKVPIKETLADINTASGSIKRMATGLEKGYDVKLTEMSDKMESVLAGLEKTSRLLENMIWTNADVIEKQSATWRTPLKTSTSSPGSCVSTRQHSHERPAENINIRKGKIVYYEPLPSFKGHAPATVASFRDNNRHIHCRRHVGRMRD